MVNGRTTYGEVVDTSLGRLIGDQRVSEFSSEVLILLRIAKTQDAVRITGEQPVRQAAGMLLCAAGYGRYSREVHQDFFEITHKGRAALDRMSA